MVDILSVDDDEGIRMMMKRILVKEGYNVKTVEGGIQCLEILRDEKYDMILLDVMMPEMDGWETLAKIKENPSTREIPVIMVTVKANEDDKEKSFRDLADGHVAKPVVKEELIAAISWVLNPNPFE